MWLFAALLALAAATGEWSWSRAPAAGLKPAVRAGHAAVQVDGKVYIIGGCLLDVQCFNDVHLFDPATDTWTQLPFTGDAPEPRGGHSATLVGASIFVFGGASPERAFNDVYELDLIARRWKRCVAQGSGPPTRTNHAADFDGAGNIIVFGGYSGDGQYLNDVWLLNVFHGAADTWADPYSLPVGWTHAVTVGDTPSPREGHSLTVIRGRAFLLGGYTVSGLLPHDLHVLTLDDLKWSASGPSDPAPKPRQNHAAARHGDELVIVGGCQVSPALCFNDVWSLDTRTMAWTSRSSDLVTFSPREGHSATFVRGDLVVIGGCELVKTCYNDVTVLATDDPCAGSCGGHGACEGRGVSSFCSCVPGFGGHDCLTPVPCPFGCRGHGQCTSTGKCACDNGFAGASCAVDYKCPSSLGKTCSEQGQCLLSGACACFGGFSGPDCSAGAATCPSGCSGHGTCTPQSKCQCNIGWHGEACDVADSCPLSCCGHGTCGATECQCDNNWHGPACNFGLAAWDLLGRLGAQHSSNLRDQAKEKRVQAHDVGEVAQVLLDTVNTGGANADVGRAKAAALQLQAQQLMNDAAALEAQADAAGKDPTSGAGSIGAGLETCTPDLNGVQPTATFVENLGLVTMPVNQPRSQLNMARVMVDVKLPPLSTGKKADVADAKAFGVYENNGKIKKSESEVCPKECSFRGICKENTCYCEPSFYGEFCESSRTKKTGTLAMETVILVAGGCVFLSFMSTMAFLQYTAMRRRQKEREMGFNI